MCAFAAGQEPAEKVRASIARAALAALLASSLSGLAGCASQHQSSTAYSQPANMRVSQVAAEVEDDGLPAQTPPPARIRHMADDPAEPFSKNYGGQNPSALGVAPKDDEGPQRAPTPVLPRDLPPAFRAKLAAAIAADE